MNKHFAYLTQHDDADFFQKVANEQAEASRPMASQTLMKTAMENMLEGATFEKVAARLDRDIGILKIAGPCGMSMGMQKRAGAYIDQLLEQCEMTEEEFSHVFDKVAGEAIYADLVAASGHLADGLDPSHIPWLRGEMAKIGRDLTEHALMEKEAFLGALIRAGGAAIKGIAGGGARRAAAGVAGATAPARMGAKMLAADAKAAIGGQVAKARIGAKMLGQDAKALAGKIKAPFTAEGRIARGKASLAKTQAAAAKLRELGAAKPGMIADARQSAAASLDKSVVKQKAKVDGLVAKSTAPAKAPESPKAPSSTRAGGSAPAEAPAARAAAAKAGNPGAADAAAKAGKRPAGAAAPKAKAENPFANLTTGKPKRGDGLDVTDPGMGKSSPAAGAGLNAASTTGNATFKGSWEKFRDGGWKSLSGAEKQKLINAGAVAVVGGRVVTGQGMITGGDGII